MRLTEHELTEALHGAAKSVAASRPGLFKRKADPEQVWREMDRYRRYQLLQGIGDQVLPVLAALPDVPVAIGERPQVSDAQIKEVVEQVGSEGVGTGKVRRAAEVLARVALVKVALAHVPPRSEFDERNDEADGGPNTY
ncbi:tRNA pseudouridine-54 N-methylase [Nocardioides massiliensis]|uniref:tRNA pseudouridine-54 N-methylase n=1 Tax=Nocardioides massiliensis TaxID=1325935 RepID=A0ABT9NL23_9ACTN|nr:hypothetical protein [Nocardioides massiliensis]MDP9820922.1 tRNA pseudouridine-54 N-methylase [Nocardioides massiliensis]